MRRPEALTNALERCVIKAFASPEGTELERQHANFALLLGGKTIPRRASIEGRQFVKCRQAIDERPCGGRWRNVSHCAPLRTLIYAERAGLDPLFVFRPFAPSPLPDVGRG
jgi:hypothetical protein